MTKRLAPPREVWAIGGSDTTGGAGIQADLRVLQALGKQGRSAVTAITAQNRSGVHYIKPLEPNSFRKQLDALSAGYQPAVIKLGMLGSVNVVKTLAERLPDLNALVICDPLLVSSSGAPLLEASAISLFKETLLPHVDIVTPNLPELEALTGTSLDDIPAAAQALLEYGCSSVLVKGGHADGNQALDYWTNGSESWWFSLPRIALAQPVHGTGCMLGSALACFLASGLDMKDSIVLARAFMQDTLQHAEHGEVQLGTFPSDPASLPCVADDPSMLTGSWNFPTLGKTPIGFYPIVDSVAWIEKLLPLGINTIQLRIKDPNAPGLEDEIAKAAELGRRFNARVFINDHWELAAKHGAYGLHIGQDDLNTTNLREVEKAGLRLGISTHSFFEAARALTVNPSCIALGTLFETASKHMDYDPLGLERFKQIRSLSSKPVIAIGGIHLDRAKDIFAAGADGCAGISEVTEADDLAAVLKGWAALAQHAKH